MDILDFFWTFYLNHLSPIWGYFFMSIKLEVFVFPHRSSITLNITKKIICSHTVGPSGKPGKNGNF